MITKNSKKLLVFHNTDEQNTQMNKTHRCTKPGFNPEAIAQCYSGKISKDQKPNDQNS